MDGNFRPKLTSFGLNKGLERLERQPLYPAADLTARSWFVLFCQVAPKYRNTNIQKYKSAKIQIYKNREIQKYEIKKYRYIERNPQNWFILFCWSKIHPASGREVMVGRE